MTIEDKVKHTIGDLVVQLHHAQDRIKELEDKVKEYEDKK